MCLRGSTGVVQPGNEINNADLKTCETSCLFLVNDQIDAQFFSMYLFKFSTCFEQPRAHHQDNQLYQYRIWYMSLCVSDGSMCRSPICTRNGHRHRVTYTRGYIDTINSPDDEHEVSRNM